MKRKWFAFKFQWYDALKEYEPGVRLEVYDAIMEYATAGDVKDLSPLAKMAFTFIKNDIDENCARYDEIYEKRRMAANKRWAKYANECTCIQMDANALHDMHMDAINNNVDINIYDNNNNKEKKEKVEKEKSKHHYAPCVMLTEAEWGKLVEAYGEDGAAWMVQKLDDYKAASGRTYKSDYRAILNWVVGEWRKHVAEQITGAYGDSGSVESNQDRERRKRNEEFKRHIERKLRGLEQ